MHNNPLLYEINTRVWINEFSDGKIKLDEIPSDYWKFLSRKGFEYIWLMGIWKPSRKAIDKYCFENNLIEEYKSALPDFKNNDVIGSPYSIEDYEINPIFGDKNILLKLKGKLNSLGLKLILDFIPNHFNIESELLKTNPELFLKGTEEDISNDPDTYFEMNGKIFARGKDPFFPAWKDTAQLNYYNPLTREFMINRFRSITEICDGVRCDMAMLVNNAIFKTTWKDTLTRQNILPPENEFWSELTSSVKKSKSNFVFIAEAYWDTEYKLQRLGFDYTYDKTFLDRLKSDDVNDIKAHLWADDDFQKRSVRFLENHDEPRAAKIFGKEQAKAAAVAMFTTQGMKLIYDGQFEGKKIKLPVQLGRKSEEQFDDEFRLFYEKLLSITARDIFRFGKWEPIEPGPAWEGNDSNENILAWGWSLNNKRIVVVINYSDEPSQCSIKIDTKNFKEEFPLKDELNDIEYIRSAKEIYNIGLYVELQPYNSHVFSY